MQNAELIFDLANAVLTCTWMVLAYCMWRIRNLRYLRGGEFVIIMTLAAFSFTTFAKALGYTPQELWWFYSLLSGLSLTSGIVMANFLWALGRGQHYQHTCVLSIKGRRACHMALLAEVSDEPDVAQMYGRLTDQARAEVANRFKLRGEKADAH